MPGRAKPAAVIADVLATQDDKLDYLKAKLAFDRLVEPSIDTTAATREIDQMTTAAREMAGPAADDRAKLTAVRKVIYEAGPWNRNRPFSYDMTDPLGRKIHNTLLTTYLVTRRGNCVSMPTLFLILGDRLGLSVALATAPEHIFIRYTNPQGRVFNIETTSGAHAARDEWYRQNMPMSDRAIESGLYLRSLSRREGVAMLATIEVNNLVAQGRDEDAIAAAGVVLENAPRVRIPRDRGHGFHGKAGMISTRRWARIPREGGRSV